MSLSNWLVAGIVPGVGRQPLKKLAVYESALLKLLHRWREEVRVLGPTEHKVAARLNRARKRAPL
jgi:transposase